MWLSVLVFGEHLRVSREVSYTKTSSLSVLHFLGVLEEARSDSLTPGPQREKAQLENKNRKTAGQE